MPRPIPASRGAPVGRWLRLAAALALLALPGVGIRDALAKPPADTQAKLEAHLKGRAGGLTVAWADADGVALFAAGTYSRARFSPDDARLITPDTPFEICSLTKIFTALLLAVTEQEGSVRRDEPVAKYLLPADDPLQAKLRHITLLSLVTHNSGLPREMEGFPADPSAPDPFARYERRDLVAALRTAGLRAQVDREVRYSNLGVALLGEALATAWGMSYDEALRTQVLQPLDLRSAQLAFTGSPALLHLPPGHRGEKVFPTRTFRAFAPAAGLIMSARDMGRFLEFCVGTTPSPLRSALEATLKIQDNAPNYHGKIALGWWVRLDGPTPIYWHAGNVGGFSSYIALIPATRQAIAILSSDYTPPPQHIGLDLLELKLPVLVGSTPPPGGQPQRN